MFVLTRFMSSEAVLYVSTKAGCRATASLFTCSLVKAAIALQPRSTFEGIDSSELMRKKLQSPDIYPGIWRIPVCLILRLSRTTWTHHVAIRRGWHITGSSIMRMCLWRNSLFVAWSKPLSKMDFSDFQENKSCKLPQDGKSNCSSGPWAAAGRVIATTSWR